MSQLRYSVVFLWAALRLVTGQDLSSLPECGQTCFKNLMEGEASALGCPADVASCFCTKQDFNDGINDCATQNCGVDVAPTVTNFLSSMCATATVATAAATQDPTSNLSPTTPVTNDPTPTTTFTPEAPSSSTSFTEIESHALVSSTVESPTTPASTSLDSSTSPEPSQSPTSMLTSASPTATTSDARRTSSSVSPAVATSTNVNASSTTDTTSSSSASKLSLGAIIGISVAGAAVILTAIVLTMIRRHHVKTHKRKSAAYLSQFKISEPMAGSGRSYAGSHQSPQYPDEPPSELEMRSRRYEDMVPRMAPRLIS